MTTDTRTITITLTDDYSNGGDYQVARHAVAVAINHHERALKGIARNQGRTRATSQAVESHTDALARLKALQIRLSEARFEEDAVNLSDTISFEDVPDEDVPDELVGGGLRWAEDENDPDEEVD